jgi:hypothetical protein
VGRVSLEEQEKMTPLSRLAAFVLAAAAVLPAAAQEPGSAKSRNFVEAAAQSDNFEILEAPKARILKCDRSRSG